MRAKQGFLAFVLIGLSILGAGVRSAVAGDSLYGKVTEVRAADVVVFDHGTGTHVIDIVGIAVPKEGPFASEARAFVAHLVLGKNARVRLQGRVSDGEFRAQLLTADPAPGIRDVAIELLRAGLARRQGPDIQFGYKYQELSLAEAQAREKGLGLWSKARPR